MSDLDDRITDLIGKAVASASGQTPSLDGASALRSRTLRHKRRRRQSILAAIAAGVAALVVVVGFTMTAARERSPSVPTERFHVGTFTLTADFPTALIHRLSSQSSRSFTTSYPVLNADGSEIAFGDNRVWIVESTLPQGPVRPIGPSTPSTDCAQLLALDPQTGAVSGALPLSGCPTSITYAHGRVWLTTYQIGVPGYDLVEVSADPLRINHSTTIAANTSPLGASTAKYAQVIVADGDIVAVTPSANAGASELTVISERTGNLIRAISVPSNLGLVTVATSNSAGIWFGTDSGWVLRFDTQLQQLDGDLRIGWVVDSISADNRAIWATVQAVQGPVPGPAPSFDTLELNPVTGALLRDTHLPLTLVGTGGGQVAGVMEPVHSGPPTYVVTVNARSGAPENEVPLGVPVSDYPNTIAIWNARTWLISNEADTITSLTNP